MTGDADRAEDHSEQMQQARLSPFAEAQPGAASSADSASGRAPPVARLITVIAVAGALVLLTFAVLGYVAARHHDKHDSERMRAALRAGVEDVRPLLKGDEQVDSRLIELLERSSGIPDLKFESDPGARAANAQPVLNADGRIIGFLTWNKEHGLFDLVRPVAFAAIGLALALLIGAGVAVRRLRRHVAALREQERRARAIADTDPVTGLPAEQAMLHRLGVALANREIQEVVTYAVIEFDGIHETHHGDGVASADEILVAISHELAQALPDNAVLGRGHGDQFRIIITETAAVAPILRRALEVLSRPQWLGGLVRIGGHAGYAQAPRDAVGRDDMVRVAGRALSAAARKGSGTVLGYDHAVEMSSQELQFIRRELPRALAAGDLDLHYQPIVTPDGAQITGVEALCRWTHPVRGNIPPGNFIPVAEQMGIMDALGAFVLRRALSDAKRWPDFYVGVNLSPVQVKGPQIVELVRDLLEETRLEPSRLMLEITEGVLVENPDEMIRRINDLRALGVRIALDDFGSGYSNLGYLQRFPIDKLKIDRAFVTPLGRTANAGVIIQAIVALGRALGLKVLVEGVETEEQRVLLRMAGCDEMQGFLFARPVPAKAIDRLAGQQYAAQNGQAAPPADTETVLTA
ncbi:MAG: putative bifunctional diguanylate cyclase/phosphodiesterase [Xanthobacteraceae bacterium]|uniref:putative bifunctional diguanylate cyclase/phosphodiesterase n=1 Tax=Pseudolabrys sp. TaxID=1960880 RepID=UPI003D0E77F8